MSWNWKGTVGVIAVVAGISFVSNLSKSDHKINPEASKAGMDAMMAAAISKANEEMPTKINSFDGTPVTALAIRLNGRVITYDLRYDDAAELNATAADWAISRTGSVAYYCAEPSVRALLEKNYAIELNVVDQVGKSAHRHAPIRVSECKNAA